MADYDRQHRQSIRLSGEEPGFFAEQKVRELRRLATGWGMAAPRILDFGAGQGNSLPAFRRHFGAGAVTLADVSGESLAAARRRHGGEERQLLIEGPRLDAPDGSFDLVFAACVLHHVPEDEHHGWLGELPARPQQVVYRDTSQRGHL